MVAVVDDLALVDVAVAGLHFAVALLPKPAAWLTVEREPLVIRPG